MMKLDKILHGSPVGLSAAKHVEKLEGAIMERNGGFFVDCPVRGSSIEIRQEEAVRQLFLIILMLDYGYPINRLRVEHPIHFGREKKRADVIVLNNNSTDPYIIAEIKNPGEQSGDKQLKSYCNASGAPIAVWYNGIKKICYQRIPPNRFEEISDIPKESQTLISYPTMSVGNGEGNKGQRVGRVVTAGDLAVQSARRRHANRLSAAKRRAKGANERSELKKLELAQLIEGGYYVEGVSGRPRLTDSEKDVSRIRRKLYQQAYHAERRIGGDKEACKAAGNVALAKADEVKGLGVGGVEATWGAIKTCYNRQMPRRILITAALH